MKSKPNLAKKIRAFLATQTNGGSKSNSTDTTRSNSPILSRANPQGLGSIGVNGNGNQPPTIGNGNKGNEQMIGFATGNNQTTFASPNAMDEEKQINFILPGNNNVSNNNVKKIGDNQEFSSERIHTQYHL